MTALVVIFFAMTAKDVLQAAYTRLLVDKRPWLAGNADGLTDLLSYGLVGVSIYDHPHRTIAWTLLAFGYLYVGSVIGTRLGFAAEQKWGVAK